MSDTAAFSKGLLNPVHPVPSMVINWIARRHGVFRNIMTAGLSRVLEPGFNISNTFATMLQSGVFQSFLAGNETTS